MEHVYGVDVSWMSNGPAKDILNKTASIPTKPIKASSQPRSSSSPPSASPQPIPNARGDTPNRNSQNGNSNGVNIPKPIISPRGSSIRSQNSTGRSPPTGTSPQRRNSWFSNISSKFSSSSANGPSSPPPEVSKQGGEPPVPRPVPAKNAVLQHGTKTEGDGPYTPAPPRSTQAGFLGGVLRRLSASGGVLGQGVRGHHGLVERRILNIDPTRKRCPIDDLQEAKLRRVAFCVDVEIAPMPRYSDGTLATNAAERERRRKLVEKSEGDALRNSKAPPDDSPETTKDDDEKKAAKPAPGEAVATAKEDESTTDGAANKKDQESTKKKEKKKKSEEERKARKEKKRKLAEANGTIPMELHLDSSDSSDAASMVDTQAAKTTHLPTTNPVRIYRRCCQLRETPILKKVTEQLSNPANFTPETGIVGMLDLTGYWLQLADLITLGDYLAVVPVKELVMENCGLTDEGLRVILAGLLASRRPNTRYRKCNARPEADRGGVVEKVVLKNNKVGPEGWKHICLFVNMSQGLKVLDLSGIPFPRPSEGTAGAVHNETSPKHPDIATLFARSVEQRLAGATLELLNLGETYPTSAQLGTIIDGLMRCGVRRLGIASNNIDADGLSHVARYIASGKCQGLDLGGNDLRDNIVQVANAFAKQEDFWALSLAGCNLSPSSLCKILPRLSKVEGFRFVDLSHNQDLFRTSPSALSPLRRYLPQMKCLRRIHLADVAMTSEQAIALAEILPEVSGLAHINLLENPELVSLADATTEEAQEEACALYASLLAATRVSRSIVCVDIDVPTERSGEVVKAIAKQVVAYCLRNLECTQATADAAPGTEPGTPPPIAYPDVLLYLVGHDTIDESDDADLENETAPDEDYVIGGTGVVKALACCLKNRGDDSRRQSGEYIREMDSGRSTPKGLRPSKAKDMSKHLLASARKIRVRLQPALAKARANPDDENNLRRLMFLDDTLSGIIKRFEDEFPDTREPSRPAEALALPTFKYESPQASPSPSLEEAEAYPAAILSDGEEDSELHIRPVSRSNSIASQSRELEKEEGRIMRNGHRFRSGILRMEYFDLVNTIETIQADPNHVRMLHELVEDLNDDVLSEKVREKGMIATFMEEKDRIKEKLKEADPDHWDDFIESQQKARANIDLGHGGLCKSCESAVEDEVPIAAS